MATSGYSVYLNGTPFPASACTGIISDNTVADNLSDFSVSFWIKTTIDSTFDNSHSNMAIMSKGLTSTAGSWIVATSDDFPNANSIQFQITSNPGIFPIFNAQAPTMINDGNWHQVVCTYHRNATPGGYIWIDGVLQSPNYDHDNHTSSDSFSNTEPIRVGYFANTPCQDVALTNIQIYSRVLTNGEIASLQTGGGPFSDLVTYWAFNAGSGLAVADDAAGGANPLSFNSITSWSSDVPAALRVPFTKQQASMFFIL